MLDFLRNDTKRKWLVYRHAEGLLPLLGNIFQMNTDFIVMTLERKSKFHAPLNNNIQVQTFLCTQSIRVANLQIIRVQCSLFTSLYTFPPRTRIALFMSIISYLYSFLYFVAKWWQKKWRNKKLQIKLFVFPVFVFLKS